MFLHLIRCIFSYIFVAFCYRTLYEVSWIGPLDFAPWVSWLRAIGLGWLLRRLVEGQFESTYFSKVH